MSTENSKNSYGFLRIASPQVKRPSPTPYFGFYGFGTAETSVQGMAERVLVKLTSAHHRYLRSPDVPHAIKIRAGTAMRMLAWICSESKFAIVPTNEMIDLHMRIDPSAPYHDTVEHCERLLSMFKRHQQTQ